MDFRKKDCLAYSLMKEHDSDLYGYAPAYEGSGEEELVYGYSKYKSYYVYEHGAREEDFIQYCKKLEREGFTLCSSKKANGNSFAIYTDGDNIVNVSYISYRDVDSYVLRDVSYVVIAVDSVRNSTLPYRCGEYERITHTQVSVINVTFAMIVRLEDGRFIVIDSGLGAATDRLYDELCLQNVREGKPVVAAWLFSHPHSDHVNGFIGILKKYSDLIEIQSVIHNFPGESVYRGKNYAKFHNKCPGAEETVEEFKNRFSDDMTRRCEEIYRLMNEKIPQVKYTIAHAGQTFEYPGVTVEVLMTTENVYKRQMHDTNICSVVYSLNMAGGKMIALGDAVDVEAKILRKIYAKELRCDAVVLAHHALNGGDEEMYHDMRPKAAIWPNFVEGIFDGSRNLLCHYVNHFDANSVKYNFVMSSSEPAMTLYDGMPEDEIKHFAYDLGIRKGEAVNYDARKAPKNYLTEAELAEGYGDAPRYYGRGEWTETLVMNPEDKTYVITINDATAYNFEYYCNSLKRDGRYSTFESREGDRLFATHANMTNAVDVLYYDGVMTITVGRAGERTLKYC